MSPSFHPVFSLKRHHALEAYSNQNFPSSIKNAKAGRNSKAELKYYFPSLFADKLLDANTKKSLYEGSAKSAGIRKEHKEQGSFSSLIGKQAPKELSREEIQSEIQKSREKKQLYDAALEFQSLFIDSVLNAMRKNLRPQNDLLYGGFRQKLFEDMLYEEYSRMLSQTEHFHLADKIYNQSR